MCKCNVYWSLIMLFTYIVQYIKLVLMYTNIFMQGYIFLENPLPPGGKGETGFKKLGKMNNKTQELTKLFSNIIYFFSSYFSISSF